MKINLIKNKKDIGYSILVFIIALILACYFMKVWDIPWSKPESLLGPENGDMLLSSLFYKNMIETNSIWNGNLLAAPFQFNMYNFPAMTNMTVLVPVFIFGKIFNNAIIGMLIVMILAFPMAAIFSYYAIREFKVKSIICAIGALVYAFIPFKIMRMWGHFSYGNSLMIIPIAVIVLYWLYEDNELLLINKNIFKYKKNIATMLFVIVIASGEAYFAFFFCFFILVVTFIKVLNEKGYLVNVMKSTLIIIETVLVILILMLPSILNKVGQFKTLEEPVRSAAETEIYGLKLMHLFLPSNTGINKIDILSYKYSLQTVYNNENMSAFLSIFAGIGFLILIINLLASSYYKEREKQMKFLSGLNISAVLLSSIGGVSYFVAAFIYSQVRAYNRISVFIAFFSVVSLCIVGSMIIENNNNKAIKNATVIILSIIASLSIIFNGSTKSSLTTKNIYEYAKQNEYIYSFIDEIEKEVGKDAMIYQMPYYKFPESPPLNEMKDYSLATPYIYSKNDIKWSYGNYKGTEGDLWHRAVSKLPIEERILKISKSGFNGIYIDTAAYKEDELNQLLNDLDEVLQEKPIISQNRRLYFYSMKKYNSNLVSKVNASSNDIMYLNGDGMYDTETNNDSKWIWNDKESSLYIFNDSKESISKNIEMKVFTGYDQKSDFTIKCNDQKFDFKVNNQGSKCDIDINLKPGMNRIEFGTNAQKVDAPLEQRNLYFRITDFNFVI